MDRDSDWRRSARTVTRLVPLVDDQLYRQAIVRRWSAGIDTANLCMGISKGQSSPASSRGRLPDLEYPGRVRRHVESREGLRRRVDLEYLHYSGTERHRSVDIDYFNFLSQTPMMRHLVIASCNGFKAERIRLGFVVPTFLKQQIRLPARYEEQRRIAEVLAACDRGARPAGTQARRAPAAEATGSCSSSSPAACG